LPTVASQGSIPPSCYRKLGEMPAGVHGGDRGTHARKMLSRRKTSKPFVLE
jgi:hypothetical protein